MFRDTNYFRICNNIRFMKKIFLNRKKTNERQKENGTEIMTKQIKTLHY